MNKIIASVGLSVGLSLGAANTAEAFPMQQQANIEALTQKPTTCEYTVISPTETARLLGNSGLSGSGLCNEVLNFQSKNNLRPDGDVGKATAKKMIDKSKNPCGIYGSSVDDCFLGIQSTGNLGTLLTVKDGKIIQNMPARFGNPAKAKGKSTPEGTFKIGRKAKGGYRGTNCPVKNGERQVCMWDPMFFYGGIAIHGTLAPQNPAGSLGCIGVSVENSAKLFEINRKDLISRVVVVDFQRN